MIILLLLTLHCAHSLVVNITNSDNIVLTFKTIVNAYIDPTRFRDVSSNITLETNNSVVLLDRGNGIVVKITIADISLGAAFKEIQRNGTRDIEIARQSAGPSLNTFNDFTTSYCRNPLPQSYATTREDREVFAKKGSIDCLQSRNNKRLGCPTSLRMFYLSYDQQCCCIDNCTSLPASVFNQSETIVHINQVNFIIDEPDNDCSAQLANLTDCLNDTSNNCSAQSITYSNCIAQVQEVCGISNCVHANASLLSLAPVHNFDQLRCDVGYTPTPIYTLTFELFQDGILLGNNTHVVQAKNADSHSENHYSIANSIFLHHDRYMMEKQTNNDLCFYGYFNHSLDVLNTDMWYTLSYAGPGVSPARIAEALDVFFPDGIRFLQFLSSGFGIGIDGILQPNYYLYQFANICDSTPFLTSNFTYLLPINNATFEAAISRHQPTYGLIYPRGRLMGLESMWSQLEQDTNKSLWRISVSAEMDDCEEAYIAIGLMEGDISLMSYDIVYSGCFLNMTFEVPFTAEEMNSTNSTDTQLRDFTVILQDSSQPYGIKPRLGVYTFGSFIDEELQTLQPLTDSELHVVLSIGGGFVLTILVFVLVCIYNCKVYKRPLASKSSDLDWKSPVKKICWKIQDMIPKSKSKAQNSFSMKKHGALLCFILIARIIKMLTFSFTVITLIYLRINYEQFQIMKGVSEDYRQFKNESEYWIVYVNSRRDAELTRQNDYCTQEIANCTEGMDAIDTEVANQKVSVKEYHESAKSTCNITNLEKMLGETSVASYNEKLHEWFAEYQASAQQQISTYEDWVSYAKTLRKVVCNKFIHTLISIFSDINCNAPSEPDRSPNDAGPPPEQVTQEGFSDPELTPLPTQEKGDSLSLWASLTLEPPSFDFSFPDINIDLSWIQSPTLVAVSIVASLDTILLIRRILNFFGAAGKVIKGVDQRKQVSEKLYNENKVQVNILKEDRKAADLEQAAVDKYFKCYTWLNSRLLILLKKWPLVLYFIQLFFTISIILLVIGVIIFVFLYVIFSDGMMIFLSELLSALLVQPARLQLIGSNSLIISNAYKLNSQQVANAEKAQQNRATSIRNDVNLFNTIEFNDMTLFNKRYEFSKNALLGYNSSIPDSFFCSPMPIPIQQVNVTIGDNFTACNLHPVVAQLITEFQPTAFQNRLTERVKYYYLAIRTIVRNTLYMIGSLILLLIFLQIVSKITWAVFIKMDMVRINKIFWYEKRLETKEEELSVQDLYLDLDDKTREEITKAKLVSPELAENFVGVLRAIATTKKELLLSSKEKFDEVEMNVKYRSLSDEEKENIGLVKENQQKLDEWLKKKYSGLNCPEQTHLKEYIEIVQRAKGDTLVENLNKLNSLILQILNFYLIEEKKREKDEINKN